MRFSPNGDSLLTGSRDRTVRVWEVRRNRIDVQVEGEYVAYLTFLEAGRLLVMTALNGDVRAWEPSRAQGTAAAWNLRPVELWSIKGSQSKTLRVMQLDSRPQDLLTVDALRVQMWSLRSGRPYFDLDLSAATPPTSDARVAKDRSPGIEMVDVSPDGTRLLAVANGTAYIWNTLTRREILRHRANGTPFHAAVLLNNETFAVAADRLQVRDAASNHLRKEVSLAGGKVWTFSPTRDRTVARFSRDTAVVFQTRTGDITAELPSLVGEKRMALFSQDGTLLVTVTNESATTWQLPAGRRLSQLRGGNRLRDLHISDDGRFALSQVSSLGVPHFMLWSTATGRPLVEMAGSAASITPDGRFLAVGSQDGRVSIYEMPELAPSLSELLSQAHARITRELTAEELAEHSRGERKTP